VSCLFYEKGHRNGFLGRTTKQGMLRLDINTFYIKYTQTCSGGSSLQYVMYYL